MNPTITLDDLHRSNCSNLPDSIGIYYVIAPQDMQIRFTDHTPNKAASVYPVEILSSKYSTCCDKEILYIGKANGRHGLRQRIRQYMKYGWNEAVNHKGGRAIWQIENFGSLLLTYEPCPDCERREHLLLKEYKNRNGTYPLANWRG